MFICITLNIILYFAKNIDYKKLFSNNKIIWSKVSENANQKPTIPLQPAFLNNALAGCNDMVGFCGFLRYDFLFNLS